MFKVWCLFSILLLKTEINLQMLCGTDPFPEHYRAKKYKIHDHFMTRVDFFHMMKNLPESVSDEDIGDMFDFADKNQDGKISYDEFQVMINPQKPAEMTSRPHVSDYKAKPSPKQKPIKDQDVAMTKKIAKKEKMKENSKPAQKKIDQAILKGKENQSDEPQMLSKENVKVHENFTNNVPFKTK